MNTPPKDGSVFYIRQINIFPCKWKPYKPSSEQVRKHGIMGRWQQMNEYGGWENVTMDGGRHVEVKFDWRPSVEDFQTMQDTITELVGALEGMKGIIDDSDGVVGYHLNGDVATWDGYFRDEVTDIEHALTKAKGSEQ